MFAVTIVNRGAWIMIGILLLFLISALIAAFGYYVLGLRLDPRCTCVKVNRPNKAVAQQREHAITCDLVKARFSGNDFIKPVYRKRFFLFYPYVVKRPLDHWVGDHHRCRPKFCKSAQPIKEKRNV